MTVFFIARSGGIVQGIVVCVVGGGEGKRAGRQDTRGKR